MSRQHIWAFLPPSAPAVCVPYQAKQVSGGAASWQAAEGTPRTERGVCSVRWKGRSGKAKTQHGAQAGTPTPQSSTGEALLRRDPQTGTGLQRTIPMVLVPGVDQSIKDTIKNFKRKFCVGQGCIYM